jgi:DNA-binding NtrC family response regulator
MKHTISVIVFDPADPNTLQSVNDALRGCPSLVSQVIFVAQFDDELLWAWIEVIQRGAYEFLPKPFDCDELKLHVLHAVEKHHRVQRQRDSAASVRDSTTGLKAKAAATCFSNLSKW